MRRFVSVDVTKIGIVCLFDLEFFSLGSLARGQNSFDCMPNISQILPRDGRGQESLSKIRMRLGTGRYKILMVCPIPFYGMKQDRAEKDVLKQEKEVHFVLGRPGTKGHRDEKISLS